MARRIGINDIAYYGDKLTVYEKMLVGIDEKGSPIFKTGVVRYRVNGLHACKVQELFVDGKPKELLGEPVPLKNLFKRIRHVYDFNKVLIARRNGPTQPLFITGKGMSKFRKLENR